MSKDTAANKPSNYINALPYLSVLPITEQCLDFSVVDKLNAKLTEEILQALLSEAPVSKVIPLSVQKDTPASQLKQRKALHKTFEDFQQQKHSLSLGYPIILMDDDKLGRPVAAPLFLWKVELNIEKENNDWLLTTVNEQTGHLNPILKNYLEARFELDWEKQIGLIDSINSQVVSNSCEKLSKELEIAYSAEPILEACPLPNETPQNTILNAMILGSFEPITLKEAQKLPKNLKARERKQWKTKVAALPSNAAQDELIGTIFKGHHVVAEGISKTGKTHIIASILPSLLADKGAALIVSPQPSSFNDIQHHLEQLGIKNIGILNLQDEVLDKERLIKYLEQLPKRTRTLSNFDNVTYSKQLHQYSRLRQGLETAHETLHKTTLNGWNWTELVGQCLLHHQKSDKQILSRFLDNTQFSFTAQEHETICKELEDHYVFYDKIDALKHALNALHGRFFSEQSTLESSKEAAKTGLNVYRYKNNTLYQKYLVFVGDYAEHLKFEYRDFAADMEQQIDKIERDLHLYNELYGDSFDKQSSFQNAKLKLLSMFSRRHQAIRAAKAQLLEDYEQLTQTYEQATFFQTDFPDIEEESKLADIEAKLEKVRTELQDWTASVPKLVAKKLESLSGETAYPQNFQTQYENLEKSLEQFIAQLNDAQILRKTIQLPEEAKTIADKEAFLFNLILQFQKLENEWRDIDHYYHWRKSWLSIGYKTQKVVQALVHTSSSDWLSGFQSWFYHQILTQQYSIHLPRTNETLDFQQYITDLSKLQKLISKNADIVTKERQSEQIKRIKKEKDLTLTNARPIFRNKQLKDLLHWIGLEHLGEVFPIVLATPHMAQQLLGLQTATFDTVIIDNAHDLSSKIGMELLKLGNQRIVLGRPLSDDSVTLQEESLLQWMLDQEGRRYQFLEHTHSKDAADRNRLNKSESLDPNAFQVAISNYLQHYIAPERLHLNKSIQGVLTDIIISPIHAGQPPIAIICDGGLLKQAKYDFQLAVDKTRILKAENHLIQYVWSVNWWKNSDLALQPLLAFIIDWDKQYNVATEAPKPSVEE